MQLKLNFSQDGCWQTMHVCVLLLLRWTPTLGCDHARGAQINLLGTEGAVAGVIPEGSAAADITDSETNGALRLDRRRLRTMVQHPHVPVQSAYDVEFV